MDFPDPSLLNPPEEIRTLRLTTRRFRPGDGPLLNEAFLASRGHLLPWMAWAGDVPTLDQSEARVRNFSASWLSPRAEMVFGIFRDGDERLLGSIGLVRIDWIVRGFEIGYWIRPDAEGKGYVSESCEGLCRFAFTELDARRLHIRCNVSNAKSAAVPNRLGFVAEGRLLNAASRVDGGVEDMLSFGLTPELWRAGQS
jgi:RimJ/RimL family protein N-acetyltransferase